MTDHQTASATTERRTRLIGCALSAAIVAAPFLALLVDPAAALAVMALALGATSYLAREAGRTHPESRGLAILSAVNAALAVGCVVGLLLRLAGSR